MHTRTLLSFRSARTFYLQTAFHLLYQLSVNTVKRAIQFRENDTSEWGAVLAYMVAVLH